MVQTIDTEFIYACKNDDIEKVQNLLEGINENHLNINYKNMYGNSGLLWSCHNGSKQMCRLLLNYNADVNICDDFGNSPLIIATKEGHYDLCIFLIEAQSNIHHKNYMNYCAINYAAMNNNIILVDLLMNAY